LAGPLELDKLEGLVFLQEPDGLLFLLEVVVDLKFFDLFILSDVEDGIV
jgi:hypothetical protein